ncbi:MAG: site-specific DNA-methyltransferase, partial [Chthoniobacterales bacterium]
MNQLYYGDNLQVLREHIATESVDLIYLDPPFNSKRDYNLLFKSPKGVTSEAQIEAFLDTWHWNEQAEREFDELLHQANTQVADMMRALRGFLGENDMMAYLTMMANRLLELHRVLKPTGSLYLHCDPTASHYLKIVLDGVFGKENFRNEIAWKRTTAKSQSSFRFPNNQDLLLFFSKGDRVTFHSQFVAHSEERIRTHYSNIEKATGRQYFLGDLTAEGTRKGSSGMPWRGIDIASKGNHWKYTLENLDKLDKEGRIYWPNKIGGMPRLKRYLDQQEGVQIDTVWTDLPPINSQAHESLGYPTQKPLALLERIISASSNEGDVVLDPFCGCGTAVDAAQKLKRKWIGIDITHLAISLIEKRLKDRYKG